MRRGFNVFLATVFLGWVPILSLHASGPVEPTTGLNVQAAAGTVTTAGPFTITLAGAEAAVTTCPPASDAIVAEGPLANIRQALQSGDRLDILAVGSATVLGPDGDQPEAGFPYRMAQTLKLAAPQTDITITLRGGKGLTAEAMRDAMTEALNAHSYQLILWQTGTVEALRGMPPEALFSTISNEIGLLRDKTDLILVDPQFSRFLRANTSIAPYEASLERLASLPGVTLFRRFDLMQTWADRGNIDLERAPPSERKVTNLHLHACLGRALARMVLAGAGMHAAK